MKYRIIKVLEDYFGFDLEKYHIDFEILLRKENPEQFDLTKKSYVESLNKNNSNALYLSSDLIVHVHNIVPIHELNGISAKSYFYYPICNKEEIKRIENIKNTNDYLLKIRADSIANNPRFNRVFLSRYKKNKEKWSLTKFYETSFFDSYINRLPRKLKTKCLKASSGFALISELNGVCMKTEFGNVVLISESLKYFLRFMNIYLFCNISNVDCTYAVLIAMRVFLEKEALDFDIDPRGELEIQELEMKNVEEAVKWQLEFVIGHEYAHLLLGHLTEDNTEECNGKLFNMKQNGYQESKIYTQSEQQEFEADIASINNANYNEYEQAYAVYHACLFFYYLHLGDFVNSYLCPKHNQIRTHPSPLDRVKNLRNTFPEIIDIISESDFNNVEKIVSQIEDYLKEELLPYHTDKFDKYGSFYLPSYKKKLTQDRVDF